MVHKSNFVAAIKVDGKVLRESKDRVELPFGSEYSVLLKNLDTVRMMARISIDGQDATGWLIIPAGEDIDVERYVKDLDRGNRFKFIERTTQIEEHRGIKAEDGLVRVEFKREKVYEVPKVVINYPYYPYYPGGCYPWRNYPYITYSTFSINTPTTTTGTVTYMSGGLSGAQCNTQSGSQNVQACSNDIGITAPGSISNQKFQAVSGFETESAEALVLHLVGKIGASAVKIAKTVKMKKSCETCGLPSKGHFKFCHRCGTSLEKVGG